MNLWLMYSEFICLFMGVHKYDNATWKLLNFYLQISHRAKKYTLSKRKTSKLLDDDKRQRQILRKCFTSHFPPDDPRISLHGKRKPTFFYPRWRGRVTPGPSTKYVRRGMLWQKTKIIIKKIYTGINIKHKTRRKNLKPGRIPWRIDVTLIPRQFVDSTTGRCM